MCCSQNEKPGILWIPGFNHFWRFGYLPLAYSEHLGAAFGADTLSSRLAVLHPDCPWVAHFFLAAAFDTVGLHVKTSFLN
jgi:hypothetical protein